jgi:hypothetical protein
MATPTCSTQRRPLPHQRCDMTRLSAKRRSRQQSLLEQRKCHRQRPGPRGVRRAQALLLLPMVRSPLHSVRDAPPPLFDLGVRLVPSPPPPPILPEPDAGHLSLWRPLPSCQRPLPHPPTPRPLPHVGGAGNRVRPQQRGMRRPLQRGAQQRGDRHAPGDHSGRLRRIRERGPLLRPSLPFTALRLCPRRQRGIQLSAWKRSFEGRVVISSASGMERGEVFYGPTDWLGSRDPMTPIQYTRGSPTGLAD